MSREAPATQDGVEVVVTLYRGNPVSVTLPPHIIVQVEETEPGVKGDTATGGSKPQAAAASAVRCGRWLRW